MKRIALQGRAAGIQAGLIFKKNKKNNEFIVFVKVAENHHKYFKN